MLIGKNWKIESDELNITLYKQNIHQKTREKYWKVIAYYGTTKEALKGLVDREIRGTGLKDFQTIVAKIDELHDLIKTSTF